MQVCERVNAGRVKSSISIASGRRPQSPSRWSPLLQMGAESWPSFSRSRLLQMWQLFGCMGANLPRPHVFEIARHVCKQQILAEPGVCLNASKSHITMYACCPYVGQIYDIPTHFFAEEWPHAFWSEWPHALREGKVISGANGQAVSRT